MENIAEAKYGSSQPYLNRSASEVSFLEKPFFAREPNPRPPLDAIVQGWDIIGDSSWLLNFAIAGFPKCGTSTLMYHLENHPEIKVFDYERCEMSGRQYVPLMRDLYKKLPEGNYVRGIKCPRDMENPQNAIPGYSKVFPRSKLIAGVRHPVLWFESFYNFRVHNGQKMPDAEKMKGACGGGFNGVCTDRGQFHFQLANLGKTMLLPEENMLMERRRTRRRTVANFTQPVFLYEVSQLSDTDETRALALRQDLTKFLELKEEIKVCVIWLAGLLKSKLLPAGLTPSLVSLLCWSAVYLVPSGEKLRRREEVGRSECTQNRYLRYTLRQH